MALRVRVSMGLRPIDPIDPVAICAHFEIALVKLSAVAPDCAFLGPESSSFSAVTVPCGGQTAIVHNDTHHDYRQRSNICHELAHCFLGHECTPPLTEDGDRAHDGGVEAEANYLSGILLIPNEAAIHIVRQGLVTRAQRIYGVSAPMLTYRLRVSGAHRIQERHMQSTLRRSAGR
jgi:IrrE N-terminal-like domain